MIWARLYLIEDFDIYVSVSPQNMKNSKQLSRKPAPPCRSQEKVNDLPASRRRQKHFIMLRSLFNASNMLGIVTELEAIKANNNGKLPYGAITNMVKAQKVYLPWLTKKVDYWLATKGR